MKKRNIPNLVPCPPVLDLAQPVPAPDLRRVGRRADFVLVSLMGTLAPAFFQNVVPERRGPPMGPVNPLRFAATGRSCRRRNRTRPKEGDAPQARPRASPATVQRDR